MSLREQLCDAVRAFVRTHEVADAGAGRYRYAAGCTAPTLYSSTCAAMARHLLDSLDSLVRRKG